MIDAKHVYAAYEVAQEEVDCPKDATWAELGLNEDAAEAFRQLAIGTGQHAERLIAEAGQDRALAATFLAGVEIALRAAYEAGDGELPAVIAYLNDELSAAERLGAAKRLAHRQMREVYDNGGPALDDAVNRHLQAFGVTAHDVLRLGATLSDDPVSFGTGFHVALCLPGLGMIEEEADAG